MQSNKAPQIIVIPQSMLQQKSLLKISPQVSPYKVICTSQQPTLNRAVLSPSKPPTLMAAAPTTPISRPVAAVVGNKRPAPSSSPVFEDIKVEMEADGVPARKRANLDHLSPEERLMRRKLKNRVAAQTARDKKKAQTDDMERLINELQAEKQRLADENSRLQSVNTQLQVENVNLQKQNSELKSRLGEDSREQHNTNVTDELKLELPLSPVSLPPSPPVSPQILIAPSQDTPQSITRPAPATPASQQPPESAALTNEPQQQEQGCSGLVRSLQLPGLSSNDLTPLVTVDQMDCLVLIWCALWTLSKTINLQSTNNNSPSKTIFSPPPQLPLKKRSKDWNSWTPTISSTSRPPG